MSDRPRIRPVSTFAEAIVDCQNCALHAIVFRKENVTDDDSTRQVMNTNAVEFLVRHCERRADLFTSTSENVLPSNAQQELMP